MVIATGLSMMACGNPAATHDSAVPAPKDLVATQLSETSARLSWAQPQQMVRGYRVFLRDETAPFHVEPVNASSPLPPAATSYDYSSLTAGKKYNFGVQALSDDYLQNSAVCYTESIKMMTYLEAAALEGNHVPPPTSVTVQVKGSSTAELSWKDEGSTNGYNVYLRRESEPEYSAPVARLESGEISCTMTIPEEGVFVAAVQAVSEPIATCSMLAESPAFRVQDVSKKPVINTTKTTYAYIMVNYSLKGPGPYSEYGLCFSSDGIPTIEDYHIWGPTLPGDRTVSQLIPNAVLDQGREYKVCVYAKNASTVYYSDPVTLALEPEPALPGLVWTRVQNPDGIPDEIEVYESQTPLNGRPFRAWYAISDCTGDIQLKVCTQPTLTTIDKIADSYKGACYVLINGGYFDWGSNWSSPYVIDGKRIGEGYGSSRVSDASWTLATPAVLGVDYNGLPGAYWWSARPTKAYYYNLPHPTVPDAAKYWYEASDAQLSSFPGPDQLWVPYNAISAGPMVLYDGKVVVDNSHNGEWYTTNYELLASDIFPGSNPDRTAIGYTADNRIVLFVCDGRVDESDGASLPELGLIMKSIGCVAAQNLDGGGSAGIMLGPEHLNTWYQGKGDSRKMEYRSVKTSVGFFKK